MDHSSVAPDRLRHQARQHIEATRLDAAQETLEALLRSRPLDVEARIWLSDVLFARGRLRAAGEPLLQASRQLPRNAPLIVQLAQRLLARGETVAARACLDFLAQAPAPPPELLVAHAQLRFAIGEVSMARALLDRAVQAGADAPGEHFLHAMLLQFDGDIDSACDVLERCVARWPRQGDAALALANARTQTAASQRLDALRKQLASLPANPGDSGTRYLRAQFEYAVFKTLDDLGEHAQAWPALARCNALMHQLNPYDAAAATTVTDALIDASWRDDPGPDPVTASREGPMPIFIVGMPRSGTTLLDRMLSSHPQVASAGEIIDFWRQLHWVADTVPNQTVSLCRILEQLDGFDFQALGARYLAQTQWRAQGRGYYIDKLPANIQMVAFIRRALPHAPILHMVRAPMEVCFSNFKVMFGNISPYSYHMPSLAHNYAQYRRLADHWHATLPGAMLDVSYESLVRDPDVTLQQVLAHCGLPFDAAGLHPERNAAPVSTPSNAQVREPIHTRSLGEWKNYAVQLEPLRKALDTLLPT